MSDFYKSMQGLATDLLTEFNQGSIEYVKLTKGDGPPDDPGPPSEKKYPVKGAVRGVKFKYVDGTHIIASDLQTTIAVDPRFQPDMTGFLMVDGKRFKIVSVQPIPPAGTVVANRIIFRK